jgi:hypothetical protein
MSSTSGTPPAAAAAAAVQTQQYTLGPCCYKTMLSAAATDISPGWGWGWGGRKSYNNIYTTEFT